MPAISGALSAVTSAVTSSLGNILPTSDPMKDKTIKLRGGMEYSVTPLPKDIGTSKGLKKILASAGYNDHEMGGIATEKSSGKKRERRAANSNPIIKINARLEIPESTAYFSSLSVKCANDDMSWHSRQWSDTLTFENMQPPCVICPTTYYVINPYPYDAGRSIIIPSVLGNGKPPAECDFRQDVYFWTRPALLKCKDNEGKVFWL